MFVPENRAEVLEQLRRAYGVGILTVFYNGENDSGDIYDVQYNEKPAGDWYRPAFPTKFFWRIAYESNPGFEINEGGEGQIEWNLGEDKLVLRHSYRTYETHSVPSEYA